ncbi:hypothetical protein TYRP_022332 [Tyrophagus putrescentiae]|nr:hypothetical protein TYRP_022332 [Tyrophagus putrescentiae]
MSICSEPRAISVSRQFVYQDCIYFSTAEKGAWFGKYCVRQPTTTPKVVNIRKVFKGLVSNLDTAVEIPIDNLLDLRELVNDSSISSLLIVSYKNNRRILFQQNETGQLSAEVNSDLLEGIQAFFSKGDSNNSSLNLFDENLVIQSLAYDQLQKRLYVLKQHSLEVFDLTKGKWNRVELKSVLKKKIASRKSSAPKEEDMSSQIESLICVDGRLYGKLNSGLQLSPLKVEADGQRAVVEDIVQYSWKELVNCYQNSSLLSDGTIDHKKDDGKSLQWTTQATRQWQPIKPVMPAYSHSSPPTRLAGAIVFIAAIVIALILFFLAILFYSLRVFQAAIESTSDSERAKDLERQFKLEELCESSSTTSEKPFLSPAGTSVDTSESSSQDTAWRLTSIVRKVLGKKKPRKSKRKKKQTTPSSDSSDYSSKLSIFNPNSINISRSMSMTASGTSLWSRRRQSNGSLKTIRITGDNDLQSSPVEDMPRAELATKRPFKLGYAVPGAKGPGGFKLTGSFEREMMLNKKRLV